MICPNIWTKVAELHLGWLVDVQHCNYYYMYQSWWSRHCSQHYWPWCMHLYSILICCTAPAALLIHRLAPLLQRHRGKGYHNGDLLPRAWLYASHTGDTSCSRLLGRAGGWVGTWVLGRRVGRGRQDRGIDECCYNGRLLKNWGGAHTQKNAVEFFCLKSRFHRLDIVIQPICTFSLADYFKGKIFV